MLNINDKIRRKAIKRCKEKGIVIPTFKEQKNPELISADVKKRLKNVGLWDVDPLNLYRITWKNEPVEKGGEFGKVNYLEFPSELTGVKARIVGLVGKYFPTGAHKVGAAFGCLVPRLVTGEFDPTTQKAVWPSTGNYCRGGAFDSALLGCTAVAILPEEMSRERFDWLREIGAEVIATPGCESNVKEIYDKCWDIRKNRPDCVIFNQFDEFGNHLWHYEITASAIEEVFDSIKNSKSSLAAYLSATGSAGTIGAGDRLKEIYPNMKIGASEALQCPTLLLNGFGGHRIEGIGDKHVPWIHNTRNTDMVVAIDDEACMSILRLFNEPQGIEYLSAQNINNNLIKKLPLLGISSISNLISSIKTAKYYELGKDDVIFTILTDSAAMYSSRLEELKEADGNYTKEDASKHLARYIHGAGIDNMRELSYYDRKALHNLKYYTWVEQQGKSTEDLNRLWDPEFWAEIHTQIPEWDSAIESFNSEVVK
ncbi:TPA: pyridoxal-5-phosphate-dependent protein subunit beta [bacterium]|nr:MAG: pyridoxal-5-phosphate-dependent protein subunit beta [Candidatus Hydrogenedentes bacterium CG1_02_42_14]PIU46919.1 MAG: pyridoxal-5-phosphate-dependent protein subunit beta [Candidatus Hydrogenedentes bacterium CG07_land_8_20_14_0_80_42_17]HBW46319.1 pyridoxal-5-phosphate-dependent protein subunit beta [bacterium]